jgi:G:T-mismatch repair DNA endonuclease (very short patch repair protein)
VLQSSYRNAAETEKLIDSTMRLWQERMRRDISREDARQIVELVTGFFDVLTEWEQASTTAANDHRAASSTPLESPEGHSSTGLKGRR